MSDNSESPLGDVLTSVVDYRAAEIERLRAERDMLESQLEVLDRSHADLGRKLAKAGMDAQLGQNLEAIIAMRTGFTGEPPYVGDEGVALALTQALDERDRLREIVRQGIDLIEGDCVGIAWKKGCRNFIGNGRAALSETEKPND